MGIRQPILTRGAGIRHEMNAQGSGNSTYFILLPDVKTGNGCPGGEELDNLGWPWGRDLDTGKSGIAFNYAHIRS